MTPDTGCRTLTADRGDEGRRLDLVLRRHLTDVRAASRTTVQTWIADGRVAVNGLVIRRASRRAARGDVVTVHLSAGRPARPEPADERIARSMLRVLFEDDCLLALDKPAGIVVHPTYRHGRDTLMNALLWHARGWPQEQRPSLVGRLDKHTSGLLIAAKTPAVHAALQRELTSRRSEKEYLAVVYGPVNQTKGTIDLRLGFDPTDRRRVVVAPDCGTASTTEFTRVARAGGLSLLCCRLVTGRRHQIRVHLAARGWSIVGDATYATTTPDGGPRWSSLPDTALREVVRAFPRQALHAWRTAFRHPVTNEPLVLEAPVPEDLRSLMAAARLAADMAPAAACPYSGFSSTRAARRMFARP